MNSKPGYPKNTDLASRMKTYESVYDYSLVPRIPVYARLDMRAGHTFCSNLKKPFDLDYVHTIQETTKYLCDKTNAKLAYCQSDEISLCWECPEKIPFETRIFKIESVFASMASAAFIMNGLKTTLKERIEKYYPSFDCRVLQCPIDEVANMFLWREMDCLKNSITMVALSKFSHNQLHKKNSQDKISMLNDIGVDYYRDIDEELRRGTYFKKEVYMKELTQEEIDKIPDDKLPPCDNDGVIRVSRSRISKFKIPELLLNIRNKVDVMFNDAEVICKD